MKRPSPTLHDLAAHVGLSVTTVSDALRRRGRVAEATRAKVLEGAAELGYSPNRPAQSLRSGSSLNVGIYIPRRVLGMEFYMAFAMSVADELGQYGYDLTIISDAKDPRRWTQFAAVIVVDACLSDGPLRENLDNGSTVFTAGRIEGLPTSRLAGLIEIDYWKMLTEALDGLEQQREVTSPFLIAFEPLDKYSWSQMLISSFVHWCTMRGLDPDVFTVSPDPSSWSFSEDFSRRISERKSYDLIVHGGTLLSMAARSQKLYSELVELESARTAVLTTNEIETRLIDCDVALNIRAKEFGQLSPTCASSDCSMVRATSPTNGLHPRFSCPSPVDEV